MTERDPWEERLAEDAKAEADKAFVESLVELDPRRFFLIELDDVELPGKTFDDTLRRMLVGDEDGKADDER
jgi:hypothetical protein